MEKKNVKNRYGVQVGDIFNQQCYYQDGGEYHFYQVTVLRGETQVVVREIDKKTIAFDKYYQKVVPIPNAWISDQVLVRKLHCGSDTSRARIYIDDGWNSTAWLDNLDSEGMYLEYSEGPCMAYWFNKYNPEIAGQLRLKKGSGVYAVDRSFEGIGDDCPAVIRYPDGREEGVILKELLHYEEITRCYEQINSRKAAQKREKLLEEWMES